MDINDVSQFDQYKQLLERQKATLKAGEARKGQLATGGKSRQELLDKQSMMQLQTMMRKSLKPDHQRHMIHSSFVPPPYPPSAASLATLKPILIKDLRIATYHRGRHLVTRALTEPEIMTAIMAVVEDERGDAVMLQLYQQPSESDRAASTIVSRDDVFVIKEPYLKVMGDGDFGLRVDYMSDILRINSDHELYPSKWKPKRLHAKRTPEDLKREGNLAIERKQA